VIQGADKRYTIETTGSRLIFRTAHFSTDTGSVLHSGIYNREFASVLASLAVAGFVYMMLVMNVKKTLVFHIAVILVLVACFPFFRRFIFKEKYMVTVFDRSEGKAEIYRTGTLKRRLDSFPCKNIINVMIESKKTEIENPDGVKFVQKISLQHGMAIPGFGEEKVFFLLKLILSDGTGRVIYADDMMQDVMNAHGKIKDFLRI
jgi:hypothetical protein